MPKFVTKGSIPGIGGFTLNRQARAFTTIEPTTAAA